jgi:hypothetical protein
VSRPLLTRRDLLVALAAVAVLWPLATKRLYASDEIQFFAFLRSLYFDGDLSFDNEYRELTSRGVAARSGFAETNLALLTDTGLRPNFGTIGSAVLWAPFYAAGDLGARIARGAGAEVVVDGYSWPYMAAVSLGSITLGVAGLLLAAAVARAAVGPGGGAAAAAVAFGTPLLFYTLLAPGFSHAASAAAASLLLHVWWRVRDRWQPAGLAALGAAAGLVAIVREQDAFLVLGPAADLALSGWRRLRGDRAVALPDWRGLAAGAVSAVVVAAPQLWAYATLNGRLGPSPLVSRKMTWTSPHALDVVGSAEHGFFAWTPLAVLALAGLGVLAWHTRARLPAEGGEGRRLALVLAVMTASQVYAAGSVESWSVAGSFGQRRFVSLTPVLVVGLAALWRAGQGLRLARAASATLVVLCVWWNLGLMALFGLQRMDRQRLRLDRDFREVFLVLPFEGPALAARYLVDRASFYGARRP